MSCRSDTIRVSSGTAPVDVVGGGGAGGELTVTMADAVTLPPGPVAVRVYVVESAGNTRRLPTFCTEPIVWSIDTPVTSPVTSHRSVEDCPRVTEVGSAVNWATTGALDVVVVVVVVGRSVVGPGGGGGGGGGAFFLQPAANIASASAIEMTVIFRWSNMNIASRILNYFPQKGLSLVPTVVNCSTWLPSASMV